MTVGTSIPTRLLDGRVSKREEERRTKGIMGRVGRMERGGGAKRGKGRATDRASVPWETREEGEG